MIASMFIGQGVDPPWVDADVLRQSIVAEHIALASEHAGADIMRLLTRGGRELERCEVVQPAMVAVCLGVHRLLEQAGVTPSIVLGHSLGELTAWAAAGGITDADAIAIAATRGRLMAREAAAHPGGMVRVKGDQAMADNAIADAALHGRLWLGAHNAPDEFALTGSEPALAHVLAHYPAVRLNVAGAWHSPMMHGAIEELAIAVMAVPQQQLRAKLIANRDGSLATAGWMVDALVRQLIFPVRWVACLTALSRLEPRRLLAVGPGKTLRALVHRTLGTLGEGKREGAVLDHWREVEMIDSMRAIEAAARA